MISLQPLFKHTPGQYRGCVRFFNNNSVGGKMGVRNLQGILEKFNIHASDRELSAMITAISVHGWYMHIWIIKVKHVPRLCSCEPFNKF